MLNETKAKGVQMDISIEKRERFMVWFFGHKECFVMARDAIAFAKMMASEDKSKTFVRVRDLFTGEWHPMCEFDGRR